MRGLVAGLDGTHPLGPALPALYQEDVTAQRFLSAFDDALAPILCTLDNIDAYFDPRLAPEDFLDWLGGWVGLSLLHALFALEHNAICDALSPFGIEITELPLRPDKIWHMIQKAQNRAAA